MFVTFWTRARVERQVGSERSVHSGIHVSWHLTSWCHQSSDAPLVSVALTCALDVYRHRRTSWSAITRSILNLRMQIELNDIHALLLLVRALILASCTGRVN